MRKIIQILPTIFDRTIFLKRHIPVLMTALLLACTGIHASAADVPSVFPVLNVYSERNADDVFEEALTSDEDEEDSQALASDVLPEDDKAPSLHLDSGLLYEILVAEFAHRQGDSRRAFRNMMKVARKTRDSRFAKQAVEIAVRERKTREILEAARFWYDLDQNAREAERFLFGFLLYENRFDELQTYMASALAKTPEERRGRKIYQYYQLLAGSKDKARAFRLMERTVQPYQDIAESHIALSLLASLNKDDAYAEAKANRALEIKPDSELAILTLAQVLADSGRSTQALSEFLEKYPGSLEVRIAHARVLIAQKEYGRAKVEFEKVLEIEPDHPLALYSLGLLSIEQSDFSGAEKYLLRYLAVLKKENRSDAESYEATFLLVQLAEEQKNYKTALERLDAISAERGGEIWLLAQVKRAQMLARLGRVREARSGFADMRRAYPSEEESLIMTEAQVLRSVKRHRDAYTILKEASEKAPASIALLYDFALSAEKLARYDEMEVALRRILALDANNQMAYNALGYSLADRNVRLDEAYVLISIALSLAPDDPYITDSMGWVLYRQGKLEEAEVLLRRAYERLPEGEVIAHLAEVLWYLGRQEEALAFFIIGKRKDPDNEVLIETIRRLGVRLR